MVIPRFGAGHLRVTHPSATLPPRRIQGFPFDLHVLGTPPAFILSQDQTLRKFTFRVLKPKLCLGPKAFANLPITLQLLRSSQTAAEYITPQTRCQIWERLCPALTDRATAPRFFRCRLPPKRQERILPHPQQSVKSMPPQNLATNQPADSTLLICWLQLCDLNQMFAYGLRFPNLSVLYQK